MRATSLLVSAHDGYLHSYLALWKISWNGTSRFSPPESVFTPSLLSRPSVTILTQAGTKANHWVLFE